MSSPLPLKLRTLITTGCNTGVGLSALSSLVSRSPRSPTAWRIIIGSRSPSSAAAAVSLLQKLDSAGIHQISWAPLDLRNMASVRGFVESVKGSLQEECGEGQGGGVDVLLLSAAVVKGTLVRSEIGGGWCEEARVNHFAQHYLVELIRPLLSPSTPSTIPRVVFVSSTLQSSIKSTESLPSLLLCSSPLSHNSMKRYSASKFVQMVSAYGWKVRLAGQAHVLAVSPGFVPNSGLGRESGWLIWGVMQFVLPWFSFTTSLAQAGKGIAHAVLLSPEELAVLEKVGNDGSVVFLDAKGDLVAPHPLIELEGETLRETWMLGKEEMEAWEAEALK